MLINKRLNKTLWSQRLQQQGSFVYIPILTRFLKCDRGTEQVQHYGPPVGDVNCFQQREASVYAFSLNIVDLPQYHYQN